MTIITERLIIRPFTLDDATSFFIHASNPNITPFLEWDTHKTIQDTIQFLEFVIKNYPENPLISLAITLKNSPDQIIGEISLRIESKGVGVFGYSLSESHWRQGIMSEAVQALIKHIFEDLNYHKICARAVIENIPSWSLMEKVGFAYEGCLKSHIFCKNKWWDLKLYGLINPEHTKNPTANKF